ncbi:hypothetical protein VTK73DRAFT_2426 [Phialemonium thermophilum]|uniref:Uncharacterized protein n=1 Tax=Phialemonium thermophilum TaxID=223376 RepID=A0ABR3VS50_9PEZI
MRRASAPLSAAALRARRAALSSFRIRRVSTAAHMANQGEYTKGGQFVRPPSAFRNAVSRDPSSPHPAEKGRYALYVSPGCPWVGDLWCPCPGTLSASPSSRGR